MTGLVKKSFLLYVMKEIGYFYFNIEFYGRPNKRSYNSIYIYILT